MGGQGSGDWYRFNKRERVEDHIAIDVVQLHRDGKLNPGEEWPLRWSQGGKIIASIQGQCLEDGIRLSFSVGQCEGSKREITQHLRLDTTRCHFGGTRPWFLCPDCGRRAGKLHSVGAEFSCRKCQELTYNSRNENKWYRGISMAQKIRTRLGGSMNLLDPFPERPKGMHRKTYFRIRAKGHKTFREAWDWFSNMEKPSSDR